VNVYLKPTALESSDCMSDDIYLHHYPASPFSEKIRLLLGYLNLTWHSVEISSIMPRPLLMPLTGGYRKTPTLQMGANIYCDSAVIATALARLSGDATLFVNFQAQRVAEWADSSLFRTAVAINFRPEAISGFMGQLSASEVAAFQADRADLTGDTPLVNVPADAAINACTAYLQQMEHSLDNSFLTGSTPTIADFCVYHCLWFIAQNPANTAFMAPYAGVQDWMQRMAEFGHGTMTMASAEDALAHAAGTEPVLPQLDDITLHGCSIGTEVSIIPTDYGKVPVTGRLVGAAADELIIERFDPQAGRLMTNFPNVGFHIRSS